MALKEIWNRTHTNQCTVLAIPFTPIALRLGESQWSILIAIHLGNARSHQNSHLVTLSLDLIPAEPQVITPGKGLKFEQQGSPLQWKAAERHGRNFSSELNWWTLWNWFSSVVWLPEFIKNHWWWFLIYSKIREPLVPVLWETKQIQGSKISNGSLLQTGQKYRPYTFV